MKENKRGHMNHYITKKELVEIGIPEDQIIVAKSPIILINDFPLSTSQIKVLKILDILTTTFIRDCIQTNGFIFIYEREGEEDVALIKDYAHIVEPEIQNDNIYLCYFSDPKTLSRQYYKKLLSIEQQEKEYEEQDHSTRVILKDFTIKNVELSKKLIEDYIKQYSIMRGDLIVSPIIGSFIIAYFKEFIKKVDTESDKKFLIYIGDLNNFRLYIQPAALTDFIEFVHQPDRITIEESQKQYNEIIRILKEYNEDQDTNQYKILETETPHLIPPTEKAIKEKNITSIIDIKNGPIDDNTFAPTFNVSINLNMDQLTDFKCFFGESKMNEKMGNEIINAIGEHIKTQSIDLDGHKIIINKNDPKIQTFNKEII